MARTFREWDVEQTWLPPPSVLDFSRRRVTSCQPASGFDQQQAPTIDRSGMKQPLDSLGLWRTGHSPASTPVCLGIWSSFGAGLHIG